MELDRDQVCHSFPWVKELWLFGTVEPAAGPDVALDLLVVSALPPGEVRPGQRKRLQAHLRASSGRGIDLRLTTGQQLEKWLTGGGRFATTFRNRAVKLFERPPDAPGPGAEPHRPQP